MVPRLGRSAFVVRLVLLTGAGISMLQGKWAPAVMTLGIVALTLLPDLIGRELRIQFPPSLEAVAALFIYASLFLGFIDGYYQRFWWWDIAVHTSSGFLLGVFAFLAVLVLNQRERGAPDLAPSFVALFAFMFAMGVGALWEIFEFSMDQIFGFNLQNMSLVDTMSDLIVDAAGALVVSLAGWRILHKAGTESFRSRWLDGLWLDSTPSPRPPCR